MTQVLISCHGAVANVKVEGQLTHGMAGIPVTAQWDEEWQGLVKTLKVRCGEVSRIVSLEGDRQVYLPHECLIAGQRLECGMDGWDLTGALRIPTNWASCGIVKPSVAQCDGPEGAQPSPGTVEEILIRLEQAREAAQSAVSSAQTAQSSQEAAQLAVASIREILFVGADCRYHTIGEACEAASEGGTIYVMPGMYHESVICRDKMLHIQGHNRDSVVLMNDSGDYDAPPLSIAMGSVEDITIVESSNQMQPNDRNAPAHCVLIDSNSQEGKALMFRNVRFCNRLAACVGIGLRKNYRLSFVDCDFLSQTTPAVYLHESQSNDSVNQYAEFLDCSICSGAASPAILMQETPSVTGSDASVLFQRCVVHNSGGDSIRMVQYNVSQQELNGSGYLGSKVWTLDSRSAMNSDAVMDAIPATDATLTKIGVAADAKAAGDSFKELKQTKLDNTPGTWPAWTAEEQEVARGRIGIPGNFELIEEISVAEDTQILRSTEPDGTAYSFQKLYVEIKATSDSPIDAWTFFQAYCGAIAGAVYCLRNTNNGAAAIASVDNNLLHLVCSDVNSQKNISNNTSQYYLVVEKKITKIKFSKLKAGQSMRIYGVRA